MCLLVLTPWGPFPGCLFSPIITVLQQPPSRGNPGQGTEMPSQWPGHFPVPLMPISFSPHPLQLHMLPPLELRTSWPSPMLLPVVNRLLNFLPQFRPPACIWISGAPLGTEHLVPAAFWMSPICPLTPPRGPDALVQVYTHQERYKYTCACPH